MEPHQMQDATCGLNNLLSLLCRHLHASVDIQVGVVCPVGEIVSRICNILLKSRTIKCCVYISSTSKRQWDMVEMGLQGAGTQHHTVMVLWTMILWSFGFATYVFAKCAREVAGHGVGNIRGSPKWRRPKHARLILTQLNILALGVSLFQALWSPVATSRGTELHPLSS